MADYERNDYGLYKAIGKSIAGRYSVYVANLVSMMILARLFTPETFGTVAAITVFYLFFQLMSEAGLGPAIINLASLSERDRDGLFGLTVVVGIILALIFIAMKPFFQSFYGLPRVEEVVPYMAGTLIFSAASIVPMAFLLRDQQFFQIAMAGLGSMTVSTIAAYSLSQTIDPLHALASKALIASACSFCLVYLYSNGTELGRPKLGKKFSAIRPMLGFSGYQFGFNFINYFSRNLDSILVGKYIGAETLGAYEKAYMIMRYPLMLLTFAMAPAIQPVINKHRDDITRVYEVHRTFTFRLSLVGALVGVGVYLGAEHIVLILLGSGWDAVTPIVKILSLAIPVQVVLSTSGSFFQAMNRPDLLFLSGTLSAVMMVGAIVLGILTRDVVILSWCLVVAFHVNFIQAYYYLIRVVFLGSLGKYMLTMIPATILVLIMCAHAMLTQF